MQQAAEQVAAVYLGSMISADGGQPSGSVRCRKSEGAVWTMPVVVLGGDLRTCSRCPRATISSQSRHSARSVPIHRSAKAFALAPAPA
jgi:hypothetical protein